MDLHALAYATEEYFARVHREVFLGDPVANPRLYVEVLEAEEVAGVPTLVLITPWTLNGMFFPFDGIAVPAAMKVGAIMRPVFLNELPELGSYGTVNLVSDVLQIASMPAARSTARALAPRFREGFVSALDRQTVEDPSRRSLLTGRV